eukprot:TRINITY_DN7009_c0_g1_i3.p1 TRINITY_DN7009_c0_g1~~TRINITY_DN7009_c0_g1_i3.p1  ORF type:complete len:453 (+),score=106.35 TRINITY_DN7009_c0_g1_i3:1079-2437(+)
MDCEQCSLLNKSITRLRNLSQNLSVTKEWAEDFDETTLVLMNLVNTLVETLDQMKKQDVSNIISDLDEDSQEIWDLTLVALKDTSPEKREEMVDDIEKLLTELVELLNDLTWSLAPLGLLKNEEALIDSEEDTLDEELRAIKRREEMTFLGMDASTTSIVARTSSTLSASSHVCLADLDFIKELVREQNSSARRGEFSQDTLSELQTYVDKVVVSIQSCLELLEDEQEKTDVYGIMEDLPETIRRHVNLCRELFQDMDDEDLLDELDDAQEELFDLLRSTVTLFQSKSKINSKSIPSATTPTQGPALQSSSLVPPSVSPRTKIAIDQLRTVNIQSVVPPVVLPTLSAPSNDVPLSAKRRAAIAPTPVLALRDFVTKQMGSRSSSSSDTKNDEDWGDDDEDLAAQRAEFATLWGISLNDMVVKKTDDEFYKHLTKVQYINIPMPLGSFIAPFP